MLTWSVHELLVLPLPEGEPRKVALVNGDLSSLAWAGDGRSILFAVGGTLWRVSASGGAPEKVLTGRDVSLFAVSAGTRRLAYTQEVRHTSIWRVRLTAANRAGDPADKLISSSREQSGSSFSPDGRRLTFESTRSGATEIWVSDADGSHAAALTSFGGPLTGSPRWSPDGREIAFDSRASGQSDLYVVGVEGGVPERIVTGVAESALPTWSRDGRSLYFCSDVEDGSSQVWTIPRGGGRARPVTTGGGYLPQPSLDGKRVYYLRHLEHPEVWSTSVDGGDERALAGMPRLERNLFAAWTVTSPGIYFVEAEAERPRIDFFDFRTRRVDRVVEGPGRLIRGSGALALSPGGDMLLYSLRDAVMSDIMLVENFR
jgi:Tol biopolymer transport system component